LLKDLLGKTDDDVVRLATVRGVFGDARSAVFGAVYNKDYASLIEGILKNTVVPKFEHLNKFAGSGTGLTGTGLTYIDFHFYEFAQLLLTICDKFFDKFENLKKVIETVEKLEAIQNYKKSDRFVARPFNGGSAAYQPL